MFGLIVNWFFLQASCAMNPFGLLRVGLLECMMDPLTRVLVGFKFNGCLGVCFELIELYIGADLELKLVGHMWNFAYVAMV